MRAADMPKNSNPWLLQYQENSGSPIARPGDLWTFRRIERHGLTGVEDACFVTGHGFSRAEKVGPAEI
jgi:hypothetical protein